MFCVNYGKEINDKACICVNCGVAVGTSNVKTVNKEDKQWIVTLLLCLFTGSLGIHRFYTGYVGIGVLQLLMTISLILFPFTAIWVLIDLISIACGNFKTKDGNELVK